MTKLKLLKWADQKRLREEAERKAKLEAIEKEVNAHLFQIDQVFQEKFKEVIPALEEAGVRWRAQMKAYPYAHQGFLIKFIYNNPLGDGRPASCYMEIWEDGQHRWSESMAFGNWIEDKERFAKWLCDQLYITEEEYAN
jgi:hypothetical protein